MKRFVPLALSAVSLLLVGAGCFGSASVDADITADPPPAPTPSPSAEVVTQTTVTLNSQNDSGESGTATFTSLTEGGTQVVLSLTGAPADEPQPAHIHIGTCADIGAVSLPLSAVVNGQSTTVLNVSLASLLEATTSLAVNVHKSIAESNVYVACGDITK